MAPDPSRTFLFADLSGFTALTEAHGDEQAADLVGEFADCVRGLLNEDDEGMKMVGDAAMVWCPSAQRAIDVSLGIIEATDALPNFPVVRVGINTGPAVERDGDWLGAAVNVAARVAGAAGGGEVLLTEATQAAAGQLDGVRLRKRGPLMLKNVGDPVAVYAATRSDASDAESSVDPVCRMAVDPDRSAGRLVHEGREHHFCSIECIQAFTADPERYLRHQRDPGPDGA
jgi:adenylate cyclase